MPPMPDSPLPPHALDRLAREVGRERARTAATGATAFGWLGEDEVPKKIGRFEILGLLGRGGMGVVFRATDPGTKEEVAVKVLAGGPAERLRREGEAIARLEHPGIVRVRETGEERGRPFLVMDLVEGEALDEAWGGWDLRRRVEALERVARAVAHAHARGVAHRDLKPGNVRVPADGAPRVMDFGLATIEGDGTKLTQSGSVMGTPAWMAPEQVRGETAGPPADVHALGAMLYQALTGALPFEGPNPPAIYRRILDEDPPWPRRRSPDAPASLEAVCLAALEKDPAKRPSAPDLAAELERWLAGEPVRSRLPSWPARLARRARRNPLAWIGLCGAAAAALLGGSLLAVQSWRHTRGEHARDLFRDAQPLAAQALLALQAGDDAVAAKLMKEFEAKIAEAKVADPGFDGGWFEIAEYRRLTGDEEGAWAAVERGRVSRPEDALLRLETGLLLSARYRREVRRAEKAAEASARAGGPREVPAAVREELAKLLGEATAMLDAGVAGLGGQAPPGARVARAELEVLRGRFEEADALLAGLEQPEAKVLRGAIAEGRGNLAAALDWYSRAIATRETHWPAWEARAAARERLAGSRWVGGREEGESDQVDAIADWSRLVTALPGREDLRVARAAASWWLGMMRVYRQADPTGAFRAAMVDAREAVGLDAKDGEAWLWCGRAWKGIADHLASTKVDPSTAYGEALRCLQNAAGLRAGAETLIDIAAAYRMRGYWRRTDGEPGLFAEDYAEAIRAYDAALKVEPGLWHVWSNKGLIFEEQERWPEAAAAFEKALGLLGREDPDMRRRLDNARARAAGAPPPR